MKRIENTRKKLEVILTSVMYCAREGIALGGKYDDSKYYCNDHDSSEHKILCQLYLYIWKYLNRNFYCKELEPYTIY